MVAALRPRICEPVAVYSGHYKFPRSHFPVTRCGESSIAFKTGLGTSGARCAWRRSINCRACDTAICHHPCARAGNPGTFRKSFAYTATGCRIFRRLDVRHQYMARRARRIPAFTKTRHRLMGPRKCQCVNAVSRVSPLEAASRTTSSSMKFDEET